MSDAIITVSELQARELAHAGSPAPVYAIPHGVWTKPFRPLGALSGACRKQVLLVGSFLRDWDGAKHIVGELARAGVRSIAVGAGARDHLAGGDATVEVLPRVSEEELARLYDSSAAVLLPFLEATASNALLEAMAAGCPIVCPRFPSLIDEYLGDDSDAFERGRYDTAVARLLHYVRNPEQRATKSQTLMARADQFDWSRLAPRYQAAYIAVAHGRVPGDSRSLVDRAVRA
jgi:glycosyltransferase involved in cell wall biosynthesis